MTELQLNLLDELEGLEKQRLQEKKAYEQNLKLIAKGLTEKYQQSMNETLELLKVEQQVSTGLLEELWKQQKEIINLLKKPPKKGQSREEIAKTLAPLFLSLEEALVNSLSESNRSLIGELKTLL